jgi:hypothetical protein
MHASTWVESHSLSNLTLSARVTGMFVWRHNSSRLTRETIELYIQLLLRRVNHSLLIDVDCKKKWTNSKSCTVRRQEEDTQVPLLYLRRQIRTLNKLKILQIFINSLVSYVILWQFESTMLFNCLITLSGSSLYCSSVFSKFFKEKLNFWQLIAELEVHIKQYFNWIFVFLISLNSFSRTNI